MQHHHAMQHSAPLTGLLLTGGGSRAAYQVGVMEAIADIHCTAGLPAAVNPFSVITGTSAGAINAAALACCSDNYRGSVRRLVRVWRNFHCHQVFNTDALGAIHGGARWLGLMSLGRTVVRWRKERPQSLLDNAPLAELIRTMIPLQRLPELIRQGHLSALAVSASSYSTGQHVTFYDGAPEVQPWTRTQRHAVRSTLTHAHLLASSAIPFVFPAVPLAGRSGVEYFGDGSVRQSAPIAPAIHLGARRILVVGAGRLHEASEADAPTTSHSYPSMAQMAGHTLSNIFLDGLSADIERIERVNRTLAQIPAAARQGCSLAPIELLVIAPSRRLDEIAVKHLSALPAPVRALMRLMGVPTVSRDVKNSALASYLLFEAEYTQELMALGYADAWAKRHEVRRFMGWNEVADSVVPSQFMVSQV